MKTERINDPRSVLYTGATIDMTDAVSSALRALVIAIFFTSGAASLILQVVWFKQLQLVLGSATFSVSVTVASFFFGLSIGSAFGGRIADRITRPLKEKLLRYFAVIQVGIAVS